MQQHKKGKSKKGLTQGEVAKKANLSANYYAEVERVETKPSAVTVTKIIKALGVKPEEILPI